MTIGVTLNDKHCYDDYGMWLTGVDISQPEVQTHYVQVPGRTGELDLTEALTGDVRYYNGTLSMTFQTAEKVCGRSWLEQLEMVKNDLHGIRAEAIFDDSSIVYTGRCEVSGTPVAGGIYEITVEMNFESAEEKVYDHYFAVYSADDDSLTFYGSDVIPSAGEQYKGKTVTTVYDDLLNTAGTNPPWYSNRTNIGFVKIGASFRGARPRSCYRWFYEFPLAMFSGLGNLDTSNVMIMAEMFFACSLLTALDVSGFDTASATNMSSMFEGCSSLTTIRSDDSKFVTAAVTDGTDMFTNCIALVGGNGTKYDSSKTDHTMAHVDTASNPGYFTGK